jgi:hypothetical protein
VYIEVTSGREVKPMMNLHIADAEIITVVNGRGVTVMALTFKNRASYI